MRRFWSLAILVAAAGCERGNPPDVPHAAHEPAPTGPKPLVPAPPPPTTTTATIAVTPADLYAHPEWIGTTVTVDLREDLYDDAHSSGAPRHGYDVAVKDLYANRLHLVPAATSADGMTKLGTLVPPIRVTGKLTGDPQSLDLTPTTITQLAFEAPLKLASAAEILTNPAVHSGMMIEVTDDYVTGFEASVLGNSAWVGAYGTAKFLCQPKRPTTSPAGMGDYPTARVRVVGLVYNKPKYGYGHLGMMSAELVATEIEWLSPRAPSCP